ncbi:hypothetical protein, partial [Paenibacillus crassostreae]|uniref:hypothetical protein n=1 Tax=Paenibacillus crassostreae TaxID=1763538 RepID=UPI000A72A3CF
LKGDITNLLRFFMPFFHEKLPGIKMKLSIDDGYFTHYTVYKDIYSKHTEERYMANNDID